MGTRRPVSKPVPIDLALVGPTVVGSARLREGRVVPSVIDAMVLMEDALWRVSNLAPTVGAPKEGIVLHPAPSSISHLIAIHAITVFAKPDLLEEVVKHIARVAGDERRAEAALALIDAEYVPFMRLVDPSGIVVPDAEKRLADVLASDPDDEPSARLSRILDPAVLFTKDRKHLLKNRFGVWVDEEQPNSLAVTGDDWFRAGLAIRDHSFIAQMEVGGRVVIVTSKVLVGGTRKAVSVARENPVPTALLFGGLVLIWWMTRDSPFWSDLKQGVVKATTATLDEIAARTEGQPLAATRAGVTLNRWLSDHAGAGLLVTDLARALAIAGPRGLSALDLYHITGHRGAVVPILEAYPAFVSDREGRWHLGHPARLPG